MIVAVDDDCVVSEMKRHAPKAPPWNIWLQWVTIALTDGKIFTKEYAAQNFVRPKHVNTNDDISISLTSGTTGNPKW